MNDPKVLSRTSKVAKDVFVVFAIIFIISLIPLSYKAGYSNGLSGAAGVGNPEPTNPAGGQDSVGWFNYYLTSGTGILTSLALLISTLAGLRKAALENATAQTNKQTAEMQKKMQIDEAAIYLQQKAADERARKNRR